MTQHDAVPVLCCIIYRGQADYHNPANLAQEFIIALNGSLLNAKMVKPLLNDLSGIVSNIVKHVVRRMVAQRKPSHYGVVSWL